jgi:galactose-1-phosphate uridylyltransferase
MVAGEYAVGTRVVSRNEHWIAAPGKLKCLAGTESGMGVWINDITPKEAAHELREAR